MGHVRIYRVDGLPKIRVSFSRPYSHDYDIRGSILGSP